MDTFKDQHTIEIMLNKSLVGKAPQEWTDDDWRNYYRNFKRTELTPYQFAGMVWKGYSFTPVYSGGRRLESNFTAAWHIAFDFDADGASLEHLTRNGSLAWMFASFAYSTPSSTKDHPKSRVVFVFLEPLTDRDTMRALHLAMAQLFEADGSKTDAATKDSLRLYYGSPNCEVVTNWSVLLPETVDYLIENYEPPKQDLPHKDLTVVNVPASSRTAARRIEKILQSVTTAPDGERHAARNKAGYTLGGMVAAGHLAAYEAVKLLEDAVRVNTDNFKAAQRTIESSIAAGRQAPLPIEQPYKRDLDDLL